MNGAPKPTTAIVLPGEEAGPLRKITTRVAIALGLITFVALITYAGRDGYVDPEDGSVSLLDAFYYSTVSITTTGYGDIRPVTDDARLATTILVTPARVLFLILLVGTTLEILAERSRQAFRVARWRRRLRDHTIICGYGTKGRSALRTLLGKGRRLDQIVAIDPTAAGQVRAHADEVAVVAADATTQEALREAGIEQARSVIVAVDNDASAILITLTARELSPAATIVAAAREEENVHLLHQGGADGVITSSSAAGRLLGLSSDTPQVTEVLEDILTLGRGLDIVEREIGPEEAAAETAHAHEAALLAIVRNGELIRFGDPRATEVRPGDRVVELRSAAAEAEADAAER